MTRDILRRLNPTGDLRSQIDTYYEARGLRTPDAKEALLWLFSEIGELTKSWLVQDKSLPPNGARGIMIAMVLLGQRADVAVHEIQGNWMRTFQQGGGVDTVDTEGEVADVLEKLDRFAKAYGLAAPEACWRAKANRKLERLLE